MKWDVILTQIQWSTKLNQINANLLCMFEPDMKREIEFTYEYEMKKMSTIRFP